MVRACLSFSRDTRQRIVRCHELGSR
jgi:hypothetical protein